MSEQDLSHIKRQQNNSLLRSIYTEHFEVVYI